MKWIKSLFACCQIIVCLQLNAQNKYTTSQAHSHNDYEQARPFWEAWENGFGSIEADIFLNDNKLIVAHNRTETLAGRTLDSLYLVPLQKCIENNKGYVYKDKNLHLQLMIDIKTEAIATLKSLVEKLNTYPVLVKCPTLLISISGSRPDPSIFSTYPGWLWFDGEFKKDYSPEALKKVVMLSDDFAHYSKWKGEGELPEQDKQVLQELVKKAHGQGKKIRLWNAPDNSNAWQTFINLGVDYINTDHISELSTFLRK